VDALDPATPTDDKKPSELSNSLSHRYQSFLAKGYASESRLSRIFLAHLDYMLQHQSFSDISVRLKYMVGSDIAAYLHYDGPKDRLEPHALDRRAVFKPPDETDRQWNQELLRDCLKR